jgi:hypothetical protein
MKSVVHENLYTIEQHELLLELFKTEEKDTPFLAGSTEQFKLKMVFFLVMLVSFKFLFDIYLPSILQGLSLVVFAYFTVEGMYKVLIGFNNSVSFGILVILAYVFCFILLMFLVGLVL